MSENENNDGILADIRNAINRIANEPEPTQQPANEQIQPTQQPTNEQIQQQQRYQQQLLQQQQQFHQQQQQRRQLDDVDNWLSNSYKINDIEKELYGFGSDVQNSVKRSPLYYGIGVLVVIGGLYFLKKNNKTEQPINDYY